MESISLNSFVLLEHLAMLLTSTLTINYFYWPFQGGASFVDHLCYLCLVLLCFHARLFVDALWSPAGKGLTSWLSFVMSYCDVVTFPLVSRFGCGAWLYRFLIFVLFLSLCIYGSFLCTKACARCVNQANLMYK